MEVTRPGDRGRVPVRPRTPQAQPAPDAVATAATEQERASGAAAAAVSTAPAGQAETPAPQADADKSVLMGVLADLHAKGLLTDAELAAKLAQVAAKP